MIVGVKHVDRDQYTIQTNNPTEEMLEKVHGNPWLESCGANQIVNCVGGLIGYDILESLCKVGNFKNQPEQVVMDYFHDWRNYKKFNSIFPHLDFHEEWANRYAELHPFAALDLFKIQAEYIHNPPSWLMRHELREGNAIGVCLLDPGHYIAILQYDTKTHEAIFADSWPQRFADGNGWLRRIKQEDLEANMHPFYLVYKRPKERE